MKKTIIGIGIYALVMLSSTTFAYTTDKNDCGLVSGTGTITTIDKFLQNYGSVFAYPQVLPKQALLQAITNLKAYCCVKPDPISCSKEEKQKLPKKYYPESAFLFDHIVDILMRRLDGVKELSYGIEPDLAGKTRREYLNTLGKDPNGAVQAQSIVAMYNEYRSNNTDNIDIATKNFSWANKPGITSLRDKYDVVCTLAAKIYTQLQSDPIPIGSKFAQTSYAKQCENMVTKRIQREYAYVKLLMVKKSTQLLDETTKAYTQKNFVEDKLMSLQKLISKVKDLFQTIVKQSAASKTCSQ